MDPAQVGPRFAPGRGPSGWAPGVAAPRLLLHMGTSQGLGPALRKRPPTGWLLLPASFLTQLVFRSRVLPLPAWCQQRAERGAKPHAPLPGAHKAPGLGGCRHPVPPQPFLSSRSRRPVGRAATPATSAAGASTSWRGPAPRGTSSTGAASSAGSAGPRCAWATTPSTRRTVSRAWGRGAGDRVLGTGGFPFCNLFARSSHARAPAPGHFYCLLHDPNAPGMDMPPSEPPVLPDGVSSRKSP